jgi:hypothetical protein
MIPSLGGYHGYATRGPNCTTYHHRRPTTPYMASLTGCLYPTPSAAHTGMYHSTAPSSTPFHGRSGCGGACHTPRESTSDDHTGKTGFRVAPDRLILTVVTSSPTPSPIPSSAHAALADPHWCAAMEEEYGALNSNGTYELVP